MITHIDDPEIWKYSEHICAGPFPMEVLFAIDHMTTSDLIMRIIKVLESSCLKGVVITGFDTSNELFIYDEVVSNNLQNKFKVTFDKRE